MTASDKAPLVIAALDVAPRTKPSNYPEPFASRMAKREKRQLGDLFGLATFGVNLTRLAPGGESALLHRHTVQEEFIYVVEGAPTLVTEVEDIQLKPGMCAGFTPNGGAHQIVNRTDADVLILEIGDRATGDEGSYPKDDLKAEMDSKGRWLFLHKDGTPY